MKRSMLHPYQVELIDEIKNRDRLAVWMDMGMGKTIASLTAVSDMLKAGAVKNVLVIGPKLVCIHTWPTEVSSWEHTKWMSVSIAVGSKIVRERAISKRSNITTINISAVQWLCSLSVWYWDMVIIDESSFFKGYATKRFEYLNKKIHTVSRVLELTGTPATNGLIHIWSQFCLLDKGIRLGKNITRFREAYFYQDRNKWNWQILPGSTDKIIANISDICVRVDPKYKAEIKCIYNTIKIYLCKTTMAKYKRFFEKSLEEFNGVKIMAKNRGVLVNKLRQFTSGKIYGEDKRIYDIHSKKLSVLKSIVEENYDKKIIVVINYKFERDEILKEFKNAISAKEKNAINKWRLSSANSPKILIAHPKSIGHGMNLQGNCHILCWYSLTWSLEDYLQMNARILRQGQSETVQIHKIIVKDTVDERIDKALTDKKVNLDHILGLVKSI